MATNDTWKVWASIGYIVYLLIGFAFIAPISDQNLVTLWFIGPFFVLMLTLGVALFITRTPHPEG